MTNLAIPMRLIASNAPSFNRALANMLEGYEYPAILVSQDYEILACNRLYIQAFGALDLSQQQHCYQVSHAYSKPCDQSGESCPLAAAKTSGHKERVLHVHQTPRGKEHIDVEMLPIFDEEGQLIFFVELLKAVPLASASSVEKEMVGDSAAFMSMLSKLTRVGDSDVSVLLLGESGTGKELAAKAIHIASKRKDNALVTLECAGLTDSLFESELFGHVKGAFTGAHNNKKGLVELANGGTLFLDEIGDVPLSMQVKLLRLLETGSYRSVGSAELKTSNFRLICATHKNVARMVEEGSFRQDLYYRINVFPITLPSLAERSSDIALIAKSLLKKISPEQDFFLTDSAVELIKTLRLKGNIRELRNLLHRAIVMADTNVLDNPLLQEAVDADLTVENSNNDREPQWLDLKSAENKYLTELMTAFNNDKTKVAKIAGISLRSLYRKIEGDSANQ
jgi:transcriptional regulator with PAS, ATPase and Fis domain